MPRVHQTVRLRAISLKLLMVVLVAQVAHGEILPKLSGQVLRVEGVSPGGEVAVLSVWHEQLLQGPHSQLTAVDELLLDDDGDGVVEFMADREIPVSSVWGVVDVKTGGSAVVAPESFPLKRMEQGKEPVFVFRKPVGRLRVKRTDLRVLVVRKEVGVGRGRVKDGDHRDADLRHDQAVDVSSDQLDVEKGDLGPTLVTGDTVIAIDPNRMDFLQLTLE